jgi:hypothetical protein
LQLYFLQLGVQLFVLVLCRLCFLPELFNLPQPGSLLALLLGVYEYLVLEFKLFQLLFQLLGLVYLFLFLNLVYIFNAVFFVLEEYFELLGFLFEVFLHLINFNLFSG